MNKEYANERLAERTSARFKALLRFDVAGAWPLNSFHCGFSFGREGKSARTRDVPGAVLGARCRAAGRAGLRVVSSPVRVGRDGVGPGRTWLHEGTAREDVGRATLCVVASRRDVVVSCDDVGRSELQAGRARFHAISGERHAVRDRRHPRGGQRDAVRRQLTSGMREMKRSLRQVNP